MRIFKVIEAPALTTVHSDSDQFVDLMGRHGLSYAEALSTRRATDSWEVVSACMTGMSVAEMCGRLDAYDEAVAREGWRARVLTDAGETGAGMVVAVGACVSWALFMAWFGAFVGVSS